MPIELSNIHLDRKQAIPLSRQLYMQLHHQILHGKILYKERLPATRTLASQLNIARGVVVNCYEMLKTDELVSGFGKGGTQVSYSMPTNNNTLTKTSTLNIQLSTRGDRIAYAREYKNSDHPLVPLPLTPSVPDFSLFPSAKWQRLSKEALETTPKWYQRNSGIPLLKKSLQTYLFQYRGIRIDNLDRLLITTGTLASLSLLAKLLTEPNDSALVDYPSWSGTEASMIQASLHIIRAPVDEEGTQLSGWQFDNNKAVPTIALITPSCQFPIGCPMSMARRDQIIQYTAKHKTWLVEDDYAAEYSYAQHPPPSILAHSRANHLIHVGTMSKLLLPSLRLGWMVVPEHIATKVSNAVNTMGIQPPYMIQQQLGLFMQHGYLNAHLAHTRAIYNERRTLCSEYIKTHKQQWLTIMPSISGMNHYLKINTQLIDIKKLKLHLEKNNLGGDIYTQTKQGIKEYYFLLGHTNLRESILEKELDSLLSFAS